MRALIVDDEPIARQILREELEVLTVEVVGQAENGEEGLLLIDSAKPDVVFVDIHMPVMDGFAMMAHVGPEHPPSFVMVTAYDQHAIQAFDAGAIDYLLKPVSPKRLAKALERSREVISSRKAAEESLRKIQQVARAATSDSLRVRKLVAKAGADFVLLGLDEVYALQADGDLTWIITAQRRYLATQNLRALEGRLSNDCFRRIHRGAIVNLEQVRKLTVISSQRWQLTLSNG